MRYNNMKGFTLSLDDVLSRTLNRCSSGPTCSLVFVFQGKPGKDGEPGELGEQVTRSAACWKDR